MKRSSIDPQIKSAHVVYRDQAIGTMGILYKFLAQIDEITILLPMLLSMKYEFWPESILFTLSNTIKE